MPIVVFTLLFNFATADPVVIIANAGDDSNPDISRLFNVQKRSLSDSYKSLGYKVITVDPSLSFAKEVREAITSAGPSSHLVVETIGHGGILKQDDRQRFPNLNFDFYDGFSATPVLPNSRMSDSQNSFVLSTTADPMVANHSGKHKIGVGDMKEWVAAYRDQHGDTPVTFHLGHCFSGAAARQLAEEGISAYSSTSDIDVLVLGKSDSERPSGYFRAYSEELARARDEIPAPSRFEIFQRAVDKWIDSEKDSNRIHKSKPWSPIEAYVYQWCSKNARSQATKQGRPRKKDVVSRVLKVATGQEKKIKASNRKKIKCDKSESYNIDDYGLEDLAQTAISSLIEHTENIGLIHVRTKKGQKSLVEMKKHKIYGGEPKSASDLVELKEKIKGWLQRGKEECRGLPSCIVERISAVYGIVGSVPPKKVAYPKVKAKCQYPGANDLKICAEDLVKLARSNPLSGYSDLEVAKAKLSSKKESCIGNGSAEIADQCFERFLKNAKSDDRKIAEKLVETMLQPVAHHGAGRSPKGGK